MGRSPRSKGGPERDGPEVPPREVGEVIRGILEDTGMRRGLALGRLVRGWKAVVGPQLARETAPTSLDDGILVVAASTPAWAAQAKFLAREIQARANRALDEDRVASVRVVLRRTGGRGR